MNPATSSRRGATDRTRTDRWRWLIADGGSRPTGLRTRLLAAGLLAGAAVGLTEILVKEIGGEVGYLSCLGAVALAAWFAGLRGGAAAIAICAVGQTPVLAGETRGLDSPSPILSLIPFVVDGALVSLLTSSVRRVSAGARSARGGDSTTSAAVDGSAERSRAALMGLQAVTASLAGAATPRDVADAIVDRGMTALGAAAGGVSRLIQDGAAVEVISVRGYPGVEPGTRFALDGPSPLRDAIVSGRPVLLPDSTSWSLQYPERPPRSVNGSAGGAIAIVPLVSRGLTLGSVVFRFAASCDFDDGTGDLVVRLAEHGAQAMDRAFAYERERSTREALEVNQRRVAILARAGDFVGSQADVRAGVSGLPGLVVPVLADWCVIELVGMRPPVLATAALTRSAHDALVHLAEEAPGDLGRLARDAEGPSIVLVDAAPRTVATTRADPDDPDVRDPEVAGILAGLGTQAILCCPVEAADATRLGSITLGASDAGRFGAEDVALVRELARRIGAAVERAGLFSAVTRFKAIVDASADAVFMFDPDTLRLTYANRGGGELVGCVPEQLLGASVLELHPAVREEAFRERLSELRSSPETSRTYSEVMVRRNGEEIPVETRIQTILLADGTRTAILTARDISERIDVEARLARIAGDERRQAAELRALIQGLGEGVLVIDPPGRIAMANHAARAILGPDLEAGLAEIERSDRDRTSAEAPTTDSLAVRGGPDVDPTALAGAAPGGSRTVQLADGRWLEVAVYDADIMGPPTDAGPASRIVVVRDVTDARNGEAAREAFLGVLSHELRTPVTTIFGFAKVLQRRSHRTDQAEMLADIEIEADRLYRIVEDLLALSRLQAGITVEGEPLLLQHLARPVVESEAQRWDGISFEVLLPADLPAVFGERTYVEQVLRNLTSNAGKYSPPGSTVRVEAEQTPGDVLVRVLDRGIGFDPEEADQLFDLHYRSPKSARQAAGAGIGLYVGRGLVSAMGGRIWARPRPGGGSEFGFSVPRYTTDSHHPVSPAAT
jgi:PAS domain S-box-containing protein